ncbi:hypothetical protein DRZ78_01185 [Candidatus Aerophobetes bacterium]|uniref:PAC2 family protein n=1 Tax=Aerophobetes bacterium TaxID=2030807 RepID=A0A662D3Z9_UNCAE|nr:MAG: hypothetical protein DRZ78_01185 [Candidatus Aerophobetes bacterium]
MADVILYERPELSSPYFIIGFGGWPDAGKVSTKTVEYLKNKLQAKKFAEIRPDNFYDFSTLRPLTTIKEGLEKKLRFSSNEFFFWKNKKSSHDLIIFLGTEPHLRWDEYANLLIGLAKELRVEKVCMIGGNYAAVPHTKESISGLVSHPELREELIKYEVDLSEYQGPASIHTLLLDSCKKANIKVINLWGNAPHYIRGWNSKVSYALLKRITKMLEIELDLEDIREEGERLVAQIDKLIGQEPKLQGYVKKLEENYELRRKPEDKDELIKEIEEFLKRQEN